MKRFRPRTLAERFAVGTSHRIKGSPRTLTVVASIQGWLTLADSSGTIKLMIHEGEAAKILRSVRGKRR